MKKILKKIKTHKKIVYLGIFVFVFIVIATIFSLFIQTKTSAANNVSNQKGFLDVLKAGSNASSFGGSMKIGGKLCLKTSSGADDCRNTWPPSAGTVGAYIRSVDIIPSTCTVGDWVFNTLDSMFYSCNATNTWVKFIMGAGDANPGTLVVSPASTNFNRTVTLSITANGADPDGITSIELFINGVAIPGCKVTTGSGSLSCTWTPPNPGSYQLKGIMFDSLANKTETDIIPLTVVNDPPTVVINSISAAPSSTPPPLVTNVSAFVSDDANSVTSISLVKRWYVNACSPGYGCWSVTNNDAVATLTPTGIGTVTASNISGLCTSYYYNLNHPDPNWTISPTFELYVVANDDKGASSQSGTRQFRCQGWDNSNGYLQPQ